MNSKLDSEASAAVSEMFDCQVAFFNIGQKHAFFLCSPDEARHAMDCVREWRDVKLATRHLAAARDAYRTKIVGDKEWERVPPSRQVISTGGSLSVAALNQAFITVEVNFKCKGPLIDVIVAGGMRCGDMRYWGQTVIDLATIDESKERGLYGVVLGTVNVYLDNSLPYDVVLVGSMPCEGWEGMCSKVEVTPGWPNDAAKEKGLAAIHDAAERGVTVVDGTVLG